MNSNTNTDPTTTTMDQTYLEQIKALKESTVSKEEFEKLQEQHKLLLEDYINGKPAAEPAEKQLRSKKELRDILFDGKRDLSNLEFIETSLELREVLINSGEPDPFLPIGKNIAPTQFDIDEANNLAAGLQHCIEYSEGDSAIFTNELQRVTKDTIRLPKRKR